MNWLRLRRISLASVVVAGSVGLACGAYAGYLQLSDNFHPVIEGELYRSAQPTADELAAYVRAHRIRTIINLRGTHPGTPWYDDEVAMADGLGVEHVDFGLSASKVVSAQQIDQLVTVMESAPRPILVHCQSGADRSGLVSALFVRRIAGMDERTAQAQLSFYYGHVAIPVISAAYAMDQSWQNAEARDRKHARTVAFAASLLH
ncbi:tyrosine-protein phosphatase [Rhizobium sp. BK376]|uniref:fused DSP-PTPase phosphatase/NAD kinase-like protein n=1 Tax=Rhizobium sp. BK376 TaxID=2512149 RepID=UPI00104E356E|nr:tyrosine-protein phosphatase [Rhizobium sp. BK376]TCR76697.1 protein tyrosine/serine phosphatase [Rhizobium sp. BK376]